MSSDGRTLENCPRVRKPGLPGGVGVKRPLLIQMHPQPAHPYSGGRDEYRSVTQNDIGLPFANQPGNGLPVFERGHQFTVMDVEYLGFDAQCPGAGFHFSAAPFRPPVKVTTSPLAAVKRT